MSRRIVFRPEARADLKTIAAFVKRDNAVRAKQLVERLQRRCKILLTRPLAGPPREEVSKGLRSLSERPYLIFYRLEGDDVMIVAIVHGARDIPTALRTRLEKDLD